MRTIGIAFLAIALGGCQHSENRYLDREVSAAEMPGTWQMTPATVKDLQNSIIGYPLPVNPSEHQIILRGDGTCTFRTVPTQGISEGQAVPRIDAECRWKLGTMGHQTLHIDILAPDGDKSVYYHFDQSKEGKLQLWQYLGDPDLWKYLEYEKQ